MRRRSMPAESHSWGVIACGIDGFNGISLGSLDQWPNGTETSETEVTHLSPRTIVSRLFDAQALGHFFVQEAFAGAIGLDPLPVNHELRNGAFAGPLDHFIGGSRSSFDINFLERDFILL